MTTDRYKVRIHCKNCGEHFILRGTLNEEGRIETGFRQCICSNKEAFKIETERV